MNSALSKILEISGTALLLAWVFANPGGFNSMTSALSGAITGSVRTLQGR